MVVIEGINMNVELVKTNRQQLSIGRGHIEPLAHIERGDYDWQTLFNMESDLLNDPSLYVDVESNIPIQCADGRTLRVEGASAIGGSFSAVMADSLGPRKFLNDHLSAAGHSRLVYSDLISKGFNIGGHDDDRSQFPSCGCAGEDRLDFTTTDLSILGYLSDNAEEIKQTLSSLRDSESGESLGINIDSKLHEKVVANARDLHHRTGSANPYVTNGNELKEAIISLGGEASLEKLHGEHKEASMVLDFRQDGYALDRGKLSERYDNKLQAFYINVPSLKFLANVLYDQRSEIDLAYVGALYYNMAAKAVLAGPTLGVITRT